MKEKDIIPISYMNGTGGNLLSNIISHAKYPYKKILNFSTYGNSHHNPHLREIHTLESDIVSPAMEKINFLLEKHIIGKATRPPFYPAVHIPESYLLSKYFEKSIKIVYDSQDYRDLSLVFFGKYFIDYMGKAEDLIKDPHEMNGCIISTIGRLYYYNMDFIKDDRYDNILYVSWRDLYKNPIENIVSKLSGFTGIPEDQFTTEFIVEWRARTQYGINEVHKLLVDNNFSGTFYNFDDRINAKY